MKPCNFIGIWADVSSPEDDERGAEVQYELNQDAGGSTVSLRLK